MLKQVDFTNAQLAQPSHEIADAAHVPFHCVEAIRMISLNLQYPQFCSAQVTFR